MFPQRELVRFQTTPSSVSQKVPVNELPPGSPTGPLRRELPIYNVISYTSLKFLIKCSQNKEFFFILPKVLRKERPRPCYPKTGPYGNKRLFPEPYFTYPSGSPVKEPSLRFPLIWLPQTEILRIQSLPLFIFQNTRYKSPLPGSPSCQDAAILDI